MKIECINKITKEVDIIGDEEVIKQFIDTNKYDIKIIENE